MVEHSRRLGKYEILSKVYADGLSTVYRARDLVQGREVMLRTIAPHLAHDARSVERFRAEIGPRSGLRHPNVTAVHDYGEADGRPYLATEPPPGITLRQLLDISGQPLPLERALGIVRQLASVLRAAQRQGMVVYGLSPRNVYLDAQNHVQLAFVGMAKAGAHSSRPAMGRAAGDQSYVAPEQVRGRELDHRANLYSLGAILYELLTRETPPAPTARGAALEPPSGLNAALPTVLDAIALKALAPRPGDRYQSAGEFLYQLDRAAKAAPPPEAASTRPVQGPSGPAARRGSKRRARAVRVLVPLAVLLLALPVAWALLVSGSGLPRAAPVPTETATSNLPVLPSVLPTETQALLASTPVPPTATPVPPTATSVPPTATPVPPTWTPWPTWTPVPPPTWTPWPTWTPVPPPTWTPTPASLAETGVIYHTVRAGETLFSIAEQYGVPVGHVMQANGIASPNQIRLGMQLRIPASGQ